MHPAKLKAEISMAESSGAIIADELKVSHTAVSNVIHGRSRSQRIEKRIAEVIGMDCNILFPPSKNTVRRTPEQMQRSA